MGTSQKILGYYLGGGFIVFLAWAACAPDRLLTPTSARHYLRWTTIAAAIGLLHPAIALAAKDIVGQVGIQLPNDAQLTERTTRTTRIVDTLTVLSTVPAIAIVAVNLL